jgi:hypothetical protein
LFDELIRSLAIKPGTHIEGDGRVRITVPAEILNSALAMSKNYLRNKTEFLACTACVQWPQG